MFSAAPSCRLSRLLSKAVAPRSSRPLAPCERGACSVKKTRCASHQRAHAPLERCNQLTTVRVSRWSPQEPLPPESQPDAPPAQLQSRPVRHVAPAPLLENQCVPSIQDNRQADTSQGRRYGTDARQSTGP